MKEESFYNKENPRLSEHNSVPEYSRLPEYNPVFPDVTFFKESYVTTREENVFQGEAPAGEPQRLLKKDKTREKTRYSLLQQILGTSIRAGAAVLGAVVAVSAISFGSDNLGPTAEKIKAALTSAKRPAFTRQSGYSSDEFKRLWERDPDAPHKYDLLNPIVYVEADCLHDGEVELVCLECGVHLHNVIPAAGHQPGDPIRENETAATCTSGGSYTEVVTCTVCGEELSRTSVSAAAAGHKEADAVKENETTASCTQDGGYDNVVYCSVCGEELSRDHVTVAATGHTPAAAVRENYKGRSCTTGGSYDSVVYCSVCKTEISRRRVTTAAMGHTPGNAVKENEVTGTCVEAGHYDSVVYCTTCKQEVSRKTVTTSTTDHTPGDPVQENVVEATCETGGSYEEVTYCSVCGEELEREHVVSLEKGHDWGEIAYLWSDNYDTVTATATCRNDSSHTLNETVETTREVISEASCETGDNIVYTANFSDPDLETQTMTITSDPLGHQYEISYEWGETDDGIVCYAYGYCLRDERHTIEEEVAGTRSVVRAPTCTEEGTYSYTANFSNSNFTTQSIEVAAAPTGHTESAAVKEWIYGNETLTGPDCLDGGAYQEVVYCSHCGTELSRSDEISVDPPGHSYNTNPSSGEVVQCSNCGALVIEAYYENNYVHYYVDTDYFESVGDIGYQFEADVRLWSYSANEYVNRGGYEYGGGGETTIPDAYRQSGERFRMDFYFSDGKYISSNDVTYP